MEATRALRVIIKSHLEDDEFKNLQAKMGIIAFAVPE